MIDVSPSTLLDDSVDIREVNDVESNSEGIDIPSTVLSTEETLVVKEVSLYVESLRLPNLWLIDVLFDTSDEVLSSSSTEIAVSNELLTVSVKLTLLSNEEVSKLSTLKRLLLSVKSVTSVGTDIPSTVLSTEETLVVKELELNSDGIDNPSILSFNDVFTVDISPYTAVSSYVESWLSNRVESEPIEPDIEPANDSSPDTLNPSSEETRVVSELIETVWSNEVRSILIVEPNESVKIKSLPTSEGVTIYLSGFKSTLKTVLSDLVNFKLPPSKSAPIILTEETSPVAIGVKSITSCVPSFLSITKSKPSMSIPIITFSFTNAANSCIVSIADGTP